MSMYHMLGETNGPDPDELMEFLFVIGQLDDTDDLEEDSEDEAEWD